MLIDLSPSILNLIKQIESLEENLSDKGLDSLFLEGNQIISIKKKYYSYLDVKLCKATSLTIVDLFKIGFESCREGKYKYFSFTKYKFDDNYLLVLLKYNEKQELENKLLSLKTQLEKEVHNV